MSQTSITAEDAGSKKELKYPLREKHVQPILNFFQPRTYDQPTANAKVDDHDVVRIVSSRGADLLQRRFSHTSSQVDFLDKRLPPKLERDPDDFKSTSTGVEPNFLFQIPGVNLVWTFLDWEIDAPSWAQVATMLDTFLFVLALCIALNCTYLTAITFQEMRGADARFEFGGFNGATWEGNWSFVLPAAEKKKFENMNDLANPNILQSGDYNATTEDISFTWGVVTNPWTISAPWTSNATHAQTTCNPASVYTSPQNVTITQDKCMYTVSCDYPCFYGRYVPDIGKIENHFYAMWAAGNSKGASPMSTQFSAMLNVSNSFLFCSLFLAIFLRSLGAPNIFFAGDPRVIEGHQYRTVATSYFFWARWNLLVMIFTAVIGVVTFIETTKLYTYVKMPDTFLEQNRASFEWLTLGPPDESPFNIAQAYVLNFFYIPMAIGFFFLAMGQRAAYLYPITSVASLSSKHMVKKRYKLQKDMATFLIVECGLPSSIGSKGGLKPGPPASIWSKLTQPKKQRLYNVLGREGVYLTGAGGLPATEAEVVADILIDAGFTHPEDLIELKLHGLMSELYGLPGMHAAAANYITTWLEQVTDMNWEEFEDTKPLVKGDKDHYFDVKRFAGGQAGRSQNSQKFIGKYLPDDQIALWATEKSGALLRFNVNVGYEKTTDRRYTVCDESGTEFDFRAGRTGDMSASHLFVRVNRNDTQVNVEDVSNTAIFRPPQP